MVYLFTYPEVFLFETGYPPVGRSHLVDKLEERVQIIQAADTLVQRGHHLVGMFRQFFGRCLLFFRFELLKTGEHF